MSITMGSYTFEGPIAFNQFRAPEVQGIYAVLIPNYSGGYNLIYIGQSSDISSRGLDSNHHAYPCWIKQAGSERNLFIAFLNLFGYSEQQRKNVEEELIKKYNPLCNKIR